MVLPEVVLSPEGGQALAGAVQKFQGAISDFGMTSFNNKMSKKLMREQMLFQSLMQKQQQDWSEKMWNKSIEYNDPSNQKARLLKAGINPAMALGGVQGATASSMTSPSGQSAPSVQFHPYSNPMDKLLEYQSVSSQNAVNMSIAEKNRAEADLVKAQLPYADKKFSSEAEEAERRIEYVIQMTKKFHAEVVNQNTQNEILKSTKKFLISEAESKSKLSKFEASIAETNDKIAKYNLQWLPEQVKLDIAFKNAQVKSELNKATLLWSQGRLTDQQYLSEVEHTRESFINRCMAEKEGEQRIKLMPYELKLVSEEMRKAHYEAEKLRHDDKFGWRLANSIGSIIGSAVGAAAVVYSRRGAPVGMKSSGSIDVGSTPTR